MAVTDRQLKQSARKGQNKLRQNKPEKTHSRGLTELVQSVAC